MAKKVEDSKPSEEVVEPTGYSSADLMRELPHQVFDGDRLETVMPEPEEESVPENETPPESSAGEEEKPPVEANEEENSPEGWEFKPKYKDHKEAEIGAREHQRKVTEATEQAKKDREAREAAEKERDELKRQLAEKDAAHQPPEKSPEPEEVKPVTQGERRNRIKASSKAALQKIAALDTYDPDYQDKVAEAWADALSEAGLGTADAPLPTGKEIEELVSKKVQEQLTAAREAEAAVRARETEQETHTRVWNKAMDLATKAGLDMDPDSADFELFTNAAKKTPGDIQNIEDQVAWAVNEVRRKLGKAALTQAGQQAAARQNQYQNAILERGNTRPDAAKKKSNDDEPYSTSSLMREVQEARRISA